MKPSRAENPGAVQQDCDAIHNLGTGNSCRLRPARAAAIPTFLGRVADWEEVWGLSANGVWAVVAAEHERQCIAFWPHPDYAAALQTGEWASHQPTRIPLAEFVEKRLPRMSQDGLSVAVFPTAMFEGVVVEPLRLRNDLIAECEQYE